MPLFTFSPLHYVNKVAEYTKETHDFLKKITDYIPRISTYEKIDTVSRSFPADSWNVISLTVTGVSKSEKDIIYGNCTNLPANMALVESRISANNTVEVVLVNYSGGAINNISNMNYLFGIIRK